MFLVTGGFGQLGLCLQAQTKNAYFTDSFNCDITDINSIKSYIKNKDIKAIVNCAAYTNTTKAESEEKELCYKVNVDGVKNLAVVASELNIPLIHISTDFVFNESENEFYESDKANPLNEYGKSKLLGEQEFLNHATKGVIIRVSYLYSCNKNNIFTTFYNLLKTKQSINVVGDQFVKVTSADALANVILLFLKNQKLLQNPSIYHFTDSGKLSIFDFANFIKQNLNSNCSVNKVLLSEYPSVIKRSYSTLLNCKKIENDLNIKRLTWQQEVEKCLQKM